MTEPAMSAARAAAPFRRFTLAAAALALLFSLPLENLISFALADDLHSHILLIPFIAAYLGWLHKNNLPAQAAPAKKTAAFFFALGGAALAWAAWAAHRATPLAREDGLALTTLAFVSCLAGLGAVFLGGARLRALAFPFALLVFMVPLPVFFREWVEASLQHGSAAAADWLFQMSGMMFFRKGMVFQLPGMTFEVAPECSGIHSTFMLFITSLVAGWMFLRQPWRRAALCVAVVPLALARNGLRIFVIGELCVHVGPQMIDSPVHHHGGPLFFAVSLVPFFAWLYFLKKTEPVKPLNDGVPSPSKN